MISGDVLRPERSLSDPLTKSSAIYSTAARHDRKPFALPNTECKQIASVSSFLKPSAYAE
jgi:hypothetical protein